MEKHFIMDFRLKLVALTCLFVAAKLEERDDHLPNLNYLKHLANVSDMNEFSTECFQLMELCLMKLVQICMYLCIYNMYYCCRDFSPFIHFSTPITRHVK